MIFIDSWPYDLLISGELNLESDITDDPVEDGGNITDHIKRKPLMFTLESLVSDTPVGEIAIHESRKIDEVSLAFGTGQIPLPSAEAYERLYAIWQNERPVTVEIPIASRTGKPGKRTFLNMALEKLSEPYGPEQDGGLNFSATFKQINIVKNVRVTVRTATPAGQGKQTTKSKVGVPYEANQVFTWNMGLPQAGGALLPNHPYAYVSVQKGEAGKRLTYFFSGSSGSDRIPVPPAYGFKNGEKLSAFAQNAFSDDLARDNEAKKAAKIAAANKVSQDNISAPNIGKGGGQNLPDGVDLSRFERKRTGPTVPGGTEKPSPGFTQSAPQGLDLSRFGR